MMGMGMEMRLRLLCVICDQDMTDHAETCPQGRMTQLCDRRSIHNCPACHKWKLEANRLDHFECRGCQTQFAIGYGVGHDVEKLPKVIILTRDDQALSGVRLPEPGTGDFPIDEVFKSLRKQTISARRVARRRK